MSPTRIAPGWVLACAMAAGPASAAVYTGVWDPPFGDNFPNLGWRGTADYFVPDSCVPAGSADITNSPACGGLAAVTRATVEFYDTRDSATQPGTEPTRRTLVLDPATMLVQTLRFVGGELAQLETSLSAPVRLISGLADFGVAPNTEFQLQFTLDGGPRLAWRDPICQRAGNTCELAFNDYTKYPPQFRIGAAPVPEPATAALVAIAALGLALVSRRPLTRRHARVQP